MKNRSLQQSLLQQILAIQQATFPSFNGSDLKKNHHKSDFGIHPQLNSRQKFKVGKHQSCSITDIEDDLLKMYAQAVKQTNKKVIKNQDVFRRKQQPQKLRTQASQQEARPINYSTIYTRRSSIDQSLYQKAIREQVSKKQWISKKQRQKQQQQKKPCRHQPFINQTSKQIMEHVNKQQLINKLKKKKQDSAKRIKQQYEQKQMNECSFTPNINKSQRKLTKSIKVQSFVVTSDTTNPQSSLRNSISVFDHLYDDYKARQLKNKEKQTKILKERANRPRIDEISRQITKNTDFDSRMINYEKKKLQKQLNIKQKQNNDIKVLYKPSINLKSHERKKESLSIGQHLYLQSKKQKSNIIEKKQPSNQKAHINKNSMKVYQERKVLVFYQLFKLLDGDEDGLISINNISLQALPHQVVKIIYPLIQQLEVMEVQLQEHQFIFSIQNLFKTLSIYEKDIVLGFIGDSKKQEQAGTFKPTINLKSRAIAACNQRTQMSIYDYCSIRQAQKQKQLETQRVQKSRRELEKCTFKPKLQSRSFKL